MGGWVKVNFGKIPKVNVFPPWISSPSGLTSQKCVKFSGLFEENNSKVTWIDTERKYLVYN